jgi:peptide/nickel transport system substrate-binding protein
VDVPGLDPVAESRYADDVVSGLRRYEGGTERAAELLRDAGFTKSGGTWKQPDGSDFKLPILVVQQASMDRPAPLMIQTIEGQLNSFGIGAQMVPLEQSSASEKFREGDFTTTLDSWAVALGNGRPYNRAAVRYGSAVGFRFNMRPQLGFFEDSLPSIVEESDGISWTNPESPSDSGIKAIDPEPLKQITVEAPPVGEPEGQLQEHPVAYLAVKALSEWAWEGEESEETDQQAALERLLWVYNYDLPHFEITRTVPQIYHDVSEWNIPDPEDDTWRYNGPRAYPSGIVGAFLHGKIEAK